MVVGSTSEKRMTGAGQVMARGREAFRQGSLGGTAEVGDLDYTSAYALGNGTQTAEVVSPWAVARRSSTVTPTQAQITASSVSS